MTNDLVIGASRGIGAATAEALAADGSTVFGVARRIDDAQSEKTGSRIIPVVGDGRDRSLASRLVREHAPRAIVIGGGATPHMAPLEEQTLESLALHWEHDVTIAFTWLQTVLSEPSDSLEIVVVVSSGAGLFGSPGSGGYAGAKATTRFLTASARESGERLGLRTRFVTVNPKMTSATGVGREAAAGYARMAGRDPVIAVDEGAPYSAAHAGRLISRLARDPHGHEADDYLLTEASSLRAL